MLKIDPDYISKVLNPQQQEAAFCIKGASLILAGAGSGKSRVVAYKIGHLISHHRVPSDRILAVTFTNKAAGEMKSRIHHILNENVPLPWVGTFHALCVRLLRRILPRPNLLKPEPGHFGNFSIFDDDDQRKLLKQLIKKHKKGLLEIEPKALKGRISSWKNQFISPAEAHNDARYEDEIEMAAYYDRYQKYLKENNALDFDDLLCETVRRLAADKELVKELSQWFLQFFVDEFQDTNPVQLKLIQLLTGKEDPNITVVGDDDQSIYGWRGADLRIIRGFHNYFADVKIFKLEQNYRSSKNIVSAAGSLIKNNKRKVEYEKKVFSENDPGELISLAYVDDERAEAERIVSLVKKNGEENYGNTAVLYRTNAQSRVIEEYMHRHQIPCKIVGGMSFFQRAEVKDVFAYLRVLVNPSDSVSLRRIINTPRRGIGETSINKMIDFASDRRMSLFQSLRFAGEVLGKASATKVAKFADLMDSLSYSPEILLPNFVERVLEWSGILAMYQEEGRDRGEDALANLGELLTSVVEIESTHPGISLEEYLQLMSLQTSADQKQVEGPAVQLMTLHSSKGLEFPVVHIGGCSERLLPLGADEPENLEEERRLMYVGMTRAEQKLYLYHAKCRKMYGRDEYFRTSRFLDEIEPDTIHLEDLGHGSQSSQDRWGFHGDQYDSNYRGQKSWGSRSKKKAESFNEFDQSPPIEFDEIRVDDDFSQETSYLDIGSVVWHTKFGPGKVLSLEGQGENAKVEVRFENGSHKKLLLKFANLKVIQ